MAPVFSWFAGAAQTDGGVGHRAAAALELALNPNRAAGRRARSLWSFSWHPSVRVLWRRLDDAGNRLDAGTG